MRLTIAAVGKLRAGPVATLLQDYVERTASSGRQLGFTGPAIFEAEAPKGLAGKKRQAREGELLLNATPKGAVIIALDERAESVSSIGLSRLLSTHRDDGAAQAVFLIGGADGHGSDILDRAAQKISFGAATWPHMLVRVMLAEQLYRAMTILSGHPYHRS